MHIQTYDFILNAANLTKLKSIQLRQQIRLKEIFRVIQLLQKFTKQEIIIKSKSSSIR